jgi:hypothetical protein
MQADTRRLEELVRTKWMPAVQEVIRELVCKARDNPSILGEEQGPCSIPQLLRVMGIEAAQVRYNADEDEFF